jgi:thiol-disulfide isomerase/thioredoxin
MKIISVAMICLVVLSVKAQNREIVFKEADWKTQLATARKENKLIFFDAYTSWCGPCKMMAREVFTKDSIADLFNQTFVNVRYDMEKGEGLALKNKYGINVYPTYLFINEDGELVHKAVGSMSPKEFIKEAENALNPENTIFGLEKTFEKSGHSETSAVAYLDALDKAYESEKMSVISKEYFDALSKPALLEEHNWKLAIKYLNNPSSEAFSYLFANISALEAKYGADEADNYFKWTFFSAIYGIKNAYAKKNGTDLAKEKSKATRKLLAQGNGYSKIVLAKLELIELAASNQWSEYVAKVDAICTDKDFSKNQGDKSSLVIEAANDLITAAQAIYYGNTLNWADLIEKGNPELFTQIQLAELLKRVLKRQGKVAEAEAMAQKEKNLRNEAAEKRLMTPAMLKD